MITFKLKYDKTWYEADEVLKLIYQSLKVPDNNFKAWEQTSCYFPYLINSPVITNLFNTLEPVIRDYNTASTNKKPLKASGPQIIFHLPDAPDCNRCLFGTHIDGQLPPDATEDTYAYIVAVALTDWTKENGTLWVPHGQESRKYIELSKYDIFLMHGNQAHGLGNNFSSSPRIGVYFRWYR